MCPGGYKVLCVCWSVGTDQFVFDVNEIAILATNIEPTKRNIMVIEDRFYDPL